MQGFLVDLLNMVFSIINGKSRSKIQKITGAKIEMAMYLSF